MNADRTQRPRGPDQREPPAPGPKRPLARLLGWHNLWILGVLAALTAIFAFLNPSAFFTVINGRNIALDTAIVLLIALGQTYVIITSGIDLSVGSNLVFSAIVAAKVMGWVSGTPEQLAAGQYPNQWAAIPAGIAVGLLSAVLWGYLNGTLITRLKLPPFIVTLGTMSMAMGAANLLSGGISVANVPPDLQKLVGMYNLFGFLPVPLLVTAVAALITAFFLARTRFGRHTYAIGSNGEAARLAGINVNRHLVKVYTIQGLLVGLAAVMDLARFNSISPASHSLDNMNAIAAVIIGGTSLFGGAGTIAGTVIGAFIPAVLQNGLIIQSIPPFWQQIVVGAIVVGAVYFDQWQRRNRK
jgi:ribose transport system permease protein